MLSAPETNYYDVHLPAFTLTNIVGGFWWTGPDKWLALYSKLKRNLLKRIHQKPITGEKERRMDAGSNYRRGENNNGIKGHFS